MDIIDKIDTNNLTFEESFSIAQYCSQLLSNGSISDNLTVRTIAIHILNSWDRIPTTTYPIWTDIIEAIGFYPYLMKNEQTMPLNSLSDKIRQQSFLSDYLPSTYLHTDQKKLSEYLLSEKNVIASAPTSFGKSLLIEEIVASKRYKNIVIIQPTLALLDETRSKLKKYIASYKIIVRTSQSPSPEKGNLFLLTAERVMEYENFPHIDLLVIDEFYKLSLRRVDNRADILNNAFLKIVGAFNSKFYLLGPNIDGISQGFSEKYNAVFFKSDFSLVDCNVVDLSTTFDSKQSLRTLENQKLVKLYALLDDLKNEQTLIYCSSPSRARRFAKNYLNHLRESGETAHIQLPLIEWINKYVNENWSLAQELQFGIAIHDGSLQKHICSSIIKYFNEGKLQYILHNYRLLQQSTDVLYSILANPEHQKDIKNILMASGIPKEKIDTAIEKTFAHPVRGDSFRGLVKESRDRILQSLYSICFCEDSFNENLWLKYADNHHGFVLVYDFYDNSTNLCGYSDICENCVIKNNFPAIYPVYYTNNRYDATLYAMSLLLEESMKHDHVPMSEEIQNRVYSSKLWEIEKISLNKKYIHHYDDEWRMVLPTNCSNRPFIKLKPKSIIIGLRTSDEDTKNIIIAAHEAGITDIRKMCISINDDLEAFPVRIRQQ